MLQWLKEAVQKREMSFAEYLDVPSIQKLEELVSSEVVPENQDMYFDLLKSPEQSVLLSNISEYLLE